MGRYIENIADIDISVSVSYSYRHFIDRFLLYINIVSVTSEISVVFRYFITLFPLFNVNLKTDNCMSKTEYLTYDTSLHLVTSLLVRNVKLKNDIDAIDYFAGDNEIYD